MGIRHDECKITQQRRMKDGVLHTFDRVLKPGEQMGHIIRNGLECGYEQTYDFLLRVHLAVAYFGEELEKQREPGFDTGPLSAGLAEYYHHMVKRVAQPRPPHGLCLCACSRRCCC